MEQAGPRVVAAGLASTPGLASTQAAVPAQGEIPAAVVRQDERAAVVRQDEPAAERAGLQACLAPALALSRAELQVDFPDESLPDDSLEQDAFPAAVAAQGDWFPPLVGSAEPPAAPQAVRAARDVLPPQAGCQPTDCQLVAARLPG